MLLSVIHMFPNPQLERLRSNFLRKLKRPIAFVRDLRLRSEIFYVFEVGLSAHPMFRVSVSSPF